MQMLSDEFTEQLMVGIFKKVEKTLVEIEKQYAIRARFLSKKNACIYANITVNTLDKWIAQGLPISKIDGCLRVDIQAIDQFMEKHLL